MGSGKLDEEFGLNPNQERFCQLYVSKEFFANGTEAYAEAYDIKLTAENYNSCKTCAWRLLTNVDVCKRINNLLDLSGMNDEYVDKQLLFVITQNADLHAKMKAIDSYNKLKARISDRIKHSLDEGIKEVNINIKRK